MSARRSRSRRWQDCAESSVLWQPIERAGSTQANVWPEMVMPPDNRPIYARIIDLRMMLLFGRGRICTEPELRKLFGGVGLNPSRIQ